MIRKGMAYLAITALVLLAAPVGAQDFAPDTVWGDAPQAVAAKAANATLISVGGARLATVPVTGGRFQFLKVSPGQYTVELTDGAGAKLATSHVSTISVGAVVKVHWVDERPVAAALPHSHKTAYIVVGAAAAAGITTAVVVNNNNNNPPVSGSR